MVTAHGPSHSLNLYSLQNVPASLTKKVTLQTHLTGNKEKMANKHEIYIYYLEVGLEVQLLLLVEEAALGGVR